ncbi:Crp/Fnr family transcriptional regulator [Dyadobacter psychrotolerans]|uniref:Crp/Fnr family transcriptional regulator n=1 Tax=Dyadobacter psychrotolerans TaxID=2541721 RepID=A0A4R5DP71_9BACT|nr:Crp/Fnr family transcriptional regulator [Dyadobacter psychrotolerans]TDE16142.1 Crp/Fnr family transcriptional regulator [Dyadobacter psychrotolerans]
MYDVFFQKFNEKISLTEQEENFIRQYLTPKKLRKRQYLLQEGDICKSIALLEKGSMRSYLVDPAGQEHITAFALEGWTIGDLSSFHSELPSTQNIDALEDCELVLISKSAHDELLRTMPKYETYFRLLITDAYLALQKRTLSMISLSLDDRYKAFMESYPNIAQRVPQHMIASYMGLSPETLSRIRSRINTSK